MNVSKSSKGAQKVNANDQESCPSGSFDFSFHKYSLDFLNELHLSSILIDDFVD